MASSPIFTSSASLSPAIITALPWQQSPNRLASSARSSTSASHFFDQCGKLELSFAAQPVFDFVTARPKVCLRSILYFVWLIQPCL